MDQQNYPQFDAAAANPRLPEPSPAPAGVEPLPCPPAGATAAPPAPDHGQALRAQIMNLFADGKPRQLTGIVAALGHGASRAEVRRQLYALKAKGRLVRPRHGDWASAKSHATAADELIDLRKHYVHRNTRAKVLDRLLQPTPAPALVQQLSLSRQRIYQVLHKLADSGEIRRFPVPVRKFRPRWLWLRSDVSIQHALLATHLTPDLGKEILSSLEPDALHSLQDIARVVHCNVCTVGQHLRQLEAAGLVTISRLGLSLYVAITPRGLTHPARSADGARAAPVNAARVLRNRRLAFVERLAVLGEATTLDLTASLAGPDRPGLDFMSGAIVARLVQLGLAEIVTAPPRGQRTYRLTEAGRAEAAVMARLRPPPTAEHLQQRIAAYRNARWPETVVTAKERVRRVRQVVATPAQQAILDSLAEQSLAGPAIRAVVSPFVRDSHDAYRMLRVLEKRGKIERTGRQGQACLWSLRQTPVPAA